MDGKQKIGLILFALLAFTAVSTAYRVTVKTEAEATAEFAKPPEMEKGRCEITRTFRSVKSAKEIAGKETTVSFTLSFTIDGKEQDLPNSFTTSETSEAGIKERTVQECDKAYAKAQDDKEYTDKEVVIRPDYGFLNQWFDMVARKWVDN